MPSSRVLKMLDTAFMALPSPSGDAKPGSLPLSLPFCEEIRSFSEIKGFPIEPATTFSPASSPDTKTMLPVQSRLGPTYSGPRDQILPASREESPDDWISSKAFTVSSFCEGSASSLPTEESASLSPCLSPMMSLATSSDTYEVFTTNEHIPFWVVRPLWKDTSFLTVSLKVTRGGEVRISILAKDSVSSLMHDSMCTSPAAQMMCSPSLEDSISTKGSALYRSFSPLVRTCKSAGFFGSTAFLRIGADW
mmetsp:Transcript_13940/g.39350  ORF Transcript_13940/g.39350 Transcript_13940/m.39350 type:complete len:250 (-) Transcript_13940:564-1313(-)